jgi:hypothetical protein
VDVSDLAEGVEFQRGGFWWRALAWLIDLIAVSVVLQLLALALFPLSNGHLQFASGLIYARDCHKLESVPAELSFPAEFGANSITDCRQSLFGLTTSRTLGISRITREGALTKVARIGYMLDAGGKPAGGLPLDILVLPLLIGFRLWFDRGGGSFGRRICRLRLADAVGAQHPAPALSVARRYAALALPLVPGWIWSSYFMLFPDQVWTFGSWFWPCWAVTGIPSLIAMGMAVVSIVRRRDAYYDRFARTAVLRVGRDNLAVALGAPPALPLPYPQQVMPDGSAAFALPPPLPRRRNYIVRHWRGELSLPVSYWVNGILGGLLVGIAIAALVYVTNRQGEARPLLWLVASSATWILAALVTIWQAVGVWHSATRYRQNGGKFWGRAAKSLMVFALGRLAYTFVLAGLPQLVGFYEIVAGDSRVGPHEFHVLANGQTLEFSGGITFGVAQEFERFLDAMAGVRTVRLNSIGGRILEAQKMSDMIRSRNLSTLVAKDCLSACTIVFLAGKERMMLPTARLGFHQPNFRGWTAATRTAAIATEEARLQRLGLSKAFAERANAATPDSMWFPDTDELLRERVVTGLVAPAQIARSPTDGPIVVTPVPVVDAAAFEAGRAKLKADLQKRASQLPIWVTVPPAAPSAPATTAK